jgi:hypothetical protein
MEMALTPSAVVAAPAVIGVVAWWLVILAAPLLLVRRYRRRRVSARRGRSLARSAANANRARWKARSPTSGQGPMVHAEVVPHADASTGEQYPPCLRSGTLEPLCRHVDLRRRLEIAVEELESRLGGLSSGRWRVEPYPLSGGRRDTLLILGSTGVFVVRATYPPGDRRNLPAHRCQVARELPRWGPACNRVVFGRDDECGGACYLGHSPGDRAARCRRRTRRGWGRDGPRNGRDLRTRRSPWRRPLR